MLKLVLLVLFVFLNVKCDLPVHCAWPSMKGKWKFSMTDGGYEKDVVWKCSYYKKPPMPITKEINIEITEPNLATDLDTGAQGTFTIIYDQALEITIEGKVLMAYFDYKHSENGVVSYCNQTLTGWYRDVEKKDHDFAENWGCLFGAMFEGTDSIHYYENQERTVFVPSEDEIKEINNEAKTWEATKYSDEFYHRVQKSFLTRKPAFKPYKSADKPLFMMDMTQFPESLDWRDYKGKNYVSPVRNQASCGSCYSFGSVGMYEARARIDSGLNWEPIFAEQELIDCSTFNQGCDGGFPYALSTWVRDLGMIDEEYDPYKGRTKECKHIAPEAKERHFVKDVEYVGGYYGACNEQLMIAELQHGPIAISFMVYSDFSSYRGGIYQHKTDERDHNDPHFEEVNHSVLVVGYGEENGVKYWIVKNSWGQRWGEKGYFRIIRGIDNCGIESIAVKATTVIEY